MGENDRKTKRQRVLYSVIHPFVEQWAARINYLNYEQILAFLFAKA